MRTQQLNNRYIGAYWPEQIVKRVDEIAKKENRSRSNCILHLVRQQLESREEKSRNNVGAEGARPTKVSTETNTNSTSSGTATPAAKMEPSTDER